MEKNIWHKMSDLEPQIDGWGGQDYVGINKDGKMVLFSGMIDENYDGFIMEHWNYMDGDYDHVDFEDIVWWMELPKRPDVLF